MFLVNNRVILRNQTDTMVHAMHVQFVLFAVMENLKASFSQINMSAHALDIFIENDTKMV